MAVHGETLDHGRADKVIIGRAAAAQLYIGLRRIDGSSKGGVAFVIDRSVGGQTVILKVFGIASVIDDSLAADDRRSPRDIELQARSLRDFDEFAAADINVTSYPECYVVGHQYLAAQGAVQFIVPTLVKNVVVIDFVPRIARRREIITAERLGHIMNIHFGVVRTPTDLDARRAGIHPGVVTNRTTRSDVRGAVWSCG